MKRWKRWLFLFHRWVGIVLCLFFVLWFVSGIFMMYVEFPQLTQPERLAGEATLDFRTATLTPAQAVARLVRGDFDRRGTPSTNEEIVLGNPRERLDAPDVIQVGMQWNRPVYTVIVRGAQPRVVFADTGDVLRDVTPIMALNSVRDFAQRAGLSATNAKVEELVQTDQWTVSAALNDHRPLYRIALHDKEGTELYVSSRTGAVVRDSRTNERVFNYFAAVTHWLYPTFIRKYPDAWAWMVDVLAGMGTIFAISGLWIGVVRWRRRRAPGKPAVPYKGLMRWHYFTGVIFGVCLLTWVFSGLLSMNPGKLNPSRSPTKEQKEIIAGREIALNEFAIPSQFAATPLDKSDWVEAELLSFNEQPFFYAVARDGQRRLLSSNAGAVQLPNAATLLAAAHNLLPGESVVHSSQLNHYDDYYYSRHPERGEKLLPILRVEFADTQRTWFHIDPLTGRLVEQTTATNRLYRWLYNGLHSWDILWLWERRPLWDIVVITFMSGGILLAMLGVVIGVRRLRY